MNISMADTPPPTKQDHYSYKPLETDDSIRFLVLHPGGRDDPIECSLYHNRITECQYRALSYEWGDEGDLGDVITVNNHPSPRAIQKNLEDVLREIRQEKEDVTLWIDAICINQNDATEKGHQVAMMGKVFREADGVIAWLGPAADNSEMAMDLIAGQESLQPRNNRREFSDNEVEALISIAYRSYWSRIWIMQEFFLAKDLEIRCGTKAVSFAAFRDYAEAMAKLNSQLHLAHWKRGPDSPPLLIHMVTRLAPQPSAPDSTLSSRFDGTLFEWIGRSYDCNSQAGNPRDYIYALLGLAEDCTYGDVVPDYDDRDETIRDALLKVIPICLKSMPAEYRRYSHRKSRARFLVKYARKMGFTLDSELQKDIARLMYINPEDVGLGEDIVDGEIDLQGKRVIYKRSFTAGEFTQMLRVRKMEDLLKLRDRPLSKMMFHEYLQSLPTFLDLDTLTKVDDPPAPT
ncbi:heterokaryon incompatibility protein-domain-containing protein [Echria macrotheca]|uniref:Heterokaryon incompatibility protein-domain-containing protein n=1 Tax=Echria macrotheca TaxID=438768 RepID=A0AAJ0BJD5_9PEZI|nr:heterokaryon incompatibility protein-domain-containing protein [Echria macrotheca]